MRPALPRTLRGRLTSVLAVGSVVLVALLIAGFNFVLARQIDNDINARLQERASVTRANVTLKHGRVVVREAPGDEPLDQLVWVYAQGRLIEKSAEPPEARAAAAVAARTPGAFHDAPKLDLRLYAERVHRHHRTIGIVVAGTSLAPYESTTRRALIASVVLGLLVLAGIIAAGRFAIGAALKPVARMTADAAAWTVDEPEHRFADLGAGDELARLGATFNDLLGRLGAALRHERRFSAEVSHELRTPLAKLIVECELALRRERTSADYRRALQSIVRNARRMQGVVETLLAVARSEGDPRTGTADASAVVTAVVSSLETGDSPVIDLQVRSAGAVRLGVDSDVAERVLAPVVANALRFAQQRASVEVSAADSTVCFMVRDDGPGVAADERESIFQPGYRGRAANGSPGTGLGLALARRLARAADGDVEYVDGTDGPAFLVSLPAA